MSCCLSNERQILNTCFENRFFTLDCTTVGGDPTILWEANGLRNPSGTFIITIVKACDGVTILVNDEEMETLDVGDTRAFTFDPLEKVEVRCTGGVQEDGCQVILSLSVNYDA